MDTGSEHYRRYLAGEDDGMTQLVRLYQKSLLLYLNTYVGNLHVAEDLTEDTFVKLATKRPKFRGESAFGTWLFAIGRRVALDYLRHHRKKPPQSLEDYGDLLTAEEDPARTLEQRERTATLHRLLYTLPPAYRQALWLVYFEGCSHRTVAAVMGKSVHSVDTLLYRAKLALKSRFEQEGITHEDL